MSMKLEIHLDSEFDFFLSRKEKGKVLSHALDRRASIKDIVESIGIPHTEIGQMILNGQRVDFSHVPESGGELKIDAVKKPFNVLKSSFLRPEPLDEVKFIADVNVIRLGKLLILAGFNVVYSLTHTDAEIAQIAESEKRIVLTRDTMLLKRKQVVFARRVRNDHPYDQLNEVLDFFGLIDKVVLFSRCTACNKQLTSVTKQDVLSLLEPKTKKYYHRFFQCPECKNVFWKGSHFERIQKTFSSLGIPMSQLQGPSD